MKRDRSTVYDIINDMLNNPDAQGIYPTSTAYIRLEHYIEQVRMEAIGWTHASMCIMLDRGIDPRSEEIPGLLAQAEKDLGKE